MFSLLITINYIVIIYYQVIIWSFVCLKKWIKKSSEAGLEPATYGLGGRCATITPHGYINDIEYSLNISFNLVRYWTIKFNIMSESYLYNIKNWWKKKLYINIFYNN